MEQKIDNEVSPQETVLTSRSTICEENGEESATTSSEFTVEGDNENNSDLVRLEEENHDDKVKELILTNNLENLSDLTTQNNIDNDTISENENDPEKQYNRILLLLERIRNVFENKVQTRLFDSIKPEHSTDEQLICSSETLDRQTLEHNDENLIISHSNETNNSQEMDKNEIAFELDIQSRLDESLEIIKKECCWLKTDNQAVELIETTNDISFNDCKNHTDDPNVEIEIKENSLNYIHSQQMNFSALKNQVDAYRFDKLDCYHYYATKTGVDLDISLNDIKLLDIMKMLYDNIVTKYADDAKKSEQFEKLHIELQITLNQIETNKENENNSDTQNYTSSINYESYNRFKMFLKILDSYFDLSSTIIFDNIIKQIGVQYHKDNLPTIINILRTINDKIYEKEEYSKLVQKEIKKLQNTNDHLTSDLSKKELELNIKNSQYEELEKKYLIIEEENLEKAKKINTLTDDLNNLNDTLSKMNKKITTLENENKELVLENQTVLINNERYKVNTENAIVTLKTYRDNIEHMKAVSNELVIASSNIFKQNKLELYNSQIQNRRLFLVNRKENFLGDRVEVILKMFDNVAEMYKNLIRSEMQNEQEENFNSDKELELEDIIYKFKVLEGLCKQALKVKENGNFAQISRQKRRAQQDEQRACDE